MEKEFTLFFNFIMKNFTKIELKVTGIKTMKFEKKIVNPSTNDLVDKVFLYLSNNYTHTHTTVQLHFPIHMNYGKALSIYSNIMICILNQGL